jgi:hypothetical protein
MGGEPPYLRLFKKINFIFEKLKNILMLDNMGSVKKVGITEQLVSK